MTSDEEPDLAERIRAAHQLADEIIEKGLQSDDPHLGAKQAGGVGLPPPGPPGRPPTDEEIEAAAREAEADQ